MAAPEVTSHSEAMPAPKQIRFVNNQGQPPAKRRRINAACLTCRKRKTRCAGEHPVCSTCTKNGHECQGYTDHPDEKKKGELDAVDEHVQVLDNGPEYAFDKTVASTGRRGSGRSDISTMSVANNHRISDGTEHARPAFRVKSEITEAADHGQGPAQKPARRRPSGAEVRQNSFSTEDGGSSIDRSPLQLHGSDSQSVVPYFRYFGPTAIVPGFKQMVVRVQDRRSSMSATSPSTSSVYTGFLSSIMSDHDTMQAEEAPFYDINDHEPVSPVILSLVELFFVHLGSTHAFLRRNQFTQMVVEKRVEPILVDVVCALGARFSDLPIFKKGGDAKVARSEYGHVYAQRAKLAIVDTFPCPSVAAVQACLLMAYDSFGADQDSALWMYLGIAIRMAVDLGLTTEDGVRFRGENDPWYTRPMTRKGSHGEASHTSKAEDPPDHALSLEEQKQVEQERLDTFWAVFFLDRVISTGTGRSVTLKDEDFEHCMPKSTLDPQSGWPLPLPILIQIIHLYGRVSDVLNKIRHAHDLTHDKLQRLGQMEHELTKLHQKMDRRLRFDANNFQAYIKNGHATTFILLHVWFHALIIVLHQPTLLTGKGAVSRIGQLKPHSRELSMSSAKTIADILAFAELLDPLCSIANPFTSQPIYIAANAFLMESRVAGSNPGSPEASTPTATQQNRGGLANSNDKHIMRHSLLASAANQNYQGCYKALKQMHAYWGGVRYILTALDQKSEGKWDCETYTVEEYESTKRSRLPSAAERLGPKMMEHLRTAPTTEAGPPLAWSLTGTTDSPNSSLTLLFQTPAANGAAIGRSATAHAFSGAAASHSSPQSAPTPPGNMIYDPIRQSRPETAAMFPPASPFVQPNTSNLRHSAGRPRRVSTVSATGKTGQQYEVASGADTTGLASSPEMRMSGPSAARNGSNSSMAMVLPPASSHDVNGHFNFQADTTSANIGAGEQHRGYLSSQTRQEPASAMSAVLFSNTAQDTNEPSNFASSGSGMASGGYSYPIGGAGGGTESGMITSTTTSTAGTTVNGGASDLHFVTFYNEADFGQHLTSFEQNEMMSWLGDYYPNDVLSFSPGMNLG
ncbi:fungal-specific transcription factor domain-containing protein [Microdochium trichocladiopsis]|uniref:Fungal-specific transcription factor domain-containing protein n=1 Tax=Microdochium trichocladiopsis TaxID=1682393 RepID=A0A9P8YIG5_9PEZI|nr:fungal-specific transcription factor domain-containing protein [Microdochium trichocladiopsis]KAH7039901.1 fungal-specific transcription factor domain-containing protein [Microdochium trichocladiopsis]